MMHQKPEPSDTDPSKIARMGEMAAVLYDEGLDWVASRLHLTHCVSWRCRIRCFLHRHACSLGLLRQEPVGVRIRRTLERLGPTFIKLGQVLSLRSDFIPEDICAELAKLQSEVPPFSSEEAKKLVESELGRPVGEMFATFERDPLAAASIAQVHGATLPDGREVILKIQRPDVAAKVRADLSLLLWAARQAERFVPKLRRLQLIEAAKEFARYTRKELDFTEEAAAARRFRENFEGNDDIYIPEVYPELTTPRILVMERIYGRPVVPWDQEKANGARPEKLARAATVALLEQIFLHGLFHADPHPGNLLLLDNGKICMIDFGMYGELSGTLQRQMLRLFALMTDGQFDEAIEALLDLATLNRYSDPVGFRTALSEVYAEWYAADIESFSLARLFFRELELGGKFGIAFPGSLILLSRALLTIESIGRTLYPQMNLSAEAAPMMKKIMLQRLDPAALWSQYQSLAPNLLELVELGPQLLRRLIDTERSWAAGEELRRPGTDPFKPTGQFLFGASVLLAAMWLTGGLLTIGLPQTLAVWQGINSPALTVFALATLGSLLWGLAWRKNILQPTP